MQKQSPVHAHHINHGATLSERAGWLVPERYTNLNQEANAVRSGVGLIDRSDVGKIEINGSDLAQWASRVSGEGVTPLQTARLPVTDAISGLCCWLRHDRGLLIVPPEDTEATVAVLSNAKEKRMHVTDVSSVYCVLQFVGPRSLDVLHRITSLDVRPSRFPTGACIQGSAMKVPVLLVHDDVGDLPSYWLFVTRDYGEFIWETVCDAGIDYRMQSIGYTTCSQLNIQASVYGEQ